jgi:hypothetical protein
MDLSLYFESGVPKTLNRIHNLAPPEACRVDCNTYSLISLTLQQAHKMDTTCTIVVGTETTNCEFTLKCKDTVNLNPIGEHNIPDHLKLQ